jgi:hypothetical protein
MSDPTEPTPEEQAAYLALCARIDALCREPHVSYDTALMALVSVAAQLCTECDYEAEVCLTACEDLLAEFRDRMQSRAAESIIQLPDQN